MKLFILLLILSVFLLSVREVFASSFPGSNGKIVFDTTRDGHYQIYTMNSDGSGQTNISNTPDSDYTPEWSADGSKLVFVSERNGVGGGQEVYSMNADGTNQQRLTNHSGADAYPSWSPDGTKIVFESDRDGPVQIFIMNADGSNVTNISNSTDDEHYPSWSPDGTKILYTNTSGANSEIYSMNTDGSSKTNLTNSSGTDQVASWSPDGTKIVFESDRSGNWEIFTMNANGSSQTNVSQSVSSSEFSGSWSPDGTKILFYSDRDGEGEVFVMNANGSNQAQLTNNSDYDEAPKWQPVSQQNTSNSSSGSSSNSNSSAPSSNTTSVPGCHSPTPGSAPDLFQISSTSNSAKLYFSPVSSNADRYYIMYGYTSGDMRFGTEFHGNSTGVISHQLNHLSPNSTYYVRVRAGNGCATGNWSNELKFKTQKRSTANWFSFFRLTR